MAATHDSVAGAATEENSTGFSFSVTIPSDNDRVLVVIIQHRDNTPSEVHSNVTLDGNALTNVESDTFDFLSSRIRISVWKYLDPPSGTYTLAGDFESEFVAARVTALVAIGADDVASTYVRDKSSVDGTTAEVAITPSDADSLIYLAGQNSADGASTWSPGTGVTELYDLDVGNTHVWTGYADASGTTEETFDATLSSSNDWGMAAIEVTPVAEPDPLDLDDTDLSATFNGPQIDGSIELASLDASATFHTPDVDSAVDLPDTDLSATFFSPTLDSAIDLNVADLSATFDTGAAVGLIDLNSLDGSAVFPDPEVADYSIDLDSLDGSATFHDPVVQESAPGEIDLDELDLSPSFDAGTLRGLIDLPEHDFSPSFDNGQLDSAFTLDTLEGTQFNSPIVGEASIDLGVLDGSATFNDPEVGSSITLDPISVSAFDDPVVGELSLDLEELSPVQFWSFIVAPPDAVIGYFYLPMKGSDR